MFYSSAQQIQQSQQIQPLSQAQPAIPQVTPTSSPPTQLQPVQIIQPKEIVNPPVGGVISGDMQLPHVVNGVFGQAANSATQSAGGIFKSRMRSLVIFGTVLILIISSGLVYTISKRSSALTTFKDPNFTMKIPKNWSGDNSYKPTSTIVLFYSPEGMGSKRGQAAAKLTLYIAIEFDRIDQQIKYLKDAKINYDIVRNDSGDENDVHYRTLEVRWKLPNDSVEQHAMYVNATRGDFTISADVASTDDNWNLHAKEADNILHSIVPACSKIVTKKALFSETSAICS